MTGRIMCIWLRRSSSFTPRPCCMTMLSTKATSGAGGPRRTSCGTEEIYLKVVRGKTAALFSAAMEVGGVIAGVPEEKVKALYAYGDALGIAFQIVDDLLDYGGTDATGKNVGDDFRERKLTLPVIRAIAEADADERAFWERTIGKGQQDHGDLDRAMSLLAQHGTMASTRADAIMWADTAKSSLDALPDHALKDMLIDLADYVVARIT